MTSYAYYNGQFGKRDEIKIPLSDRSIFFGDAVYDTAIGCYDRILWEIEHIERLLCNAQRLGIEHKYTRRKLSSLIREISVKSTFGTCMIYIQISRDLMARNHSAVGCGANLLITVEPIIIDRFPKPMKLITAEDKRYGYCDVKTINLLPAVLSSTEAETAGCDEAIFIRNNIVTECSKSNISIIKQGRLITHPISSRILPGITRAHLLEGCRKLGIPFKEIEFTKAELFSADEILISSTTKLCKTASHIDSLPVGGGANEIASAIQNYLYSEFSTFCLI